MPHILHSSEIDVVSSNATKRYLEIFSTHLRSAEGKSFYTADLVLFGLLNRNICLLKAMPPLFKDRNIHALAPLLRVQLDGLLRLHAFRLVESMDDLAAHVISGKSLRKFKDRDGQQLHDSNLVSSIKTELPWVESMYNTLSGWVHLSESHVFSAATAGSRERSIVIGVGSFESELPDSLFDEACDAVDAVHAATATLISGYFGRQTGA